MVTSLPRSVNSIDRIDNLFSQSQDRLRMEVSHVTDDIKQTKNGEQAYSTVNLRKLRLVLGKIFMKLIFVVKCSYRCQETTISNPPESLGGGPPFYARKDLAPRANFRKSQNLVFCFSGQVRHQNKGFLTRGIDCRWSQILKTFHFRLRLDF